MNTPKTLKRNKSGLWPKFPDHGDLSASSGTYFPTIGNKAMAAQFAGIVAGFEHLEAAMATLLAILLGGHDEATAGYVLRSIKSPRGRIDLMQALLTSAPQNAEISGEADDLLAEFKAVGGLRNKFVHGLWFTKENGEVFFTERNEHGLELQAARRVDPGELASVVERIQTLINRVRVGPGGLLHKRRMAATPKELTPVSPILSEFGF